MVKFCSWCHKYCAHALSFTDPCHGFSAAISAIDECKSYAAAQSTVSVCIGILYADSIQPRKIHPAFCIQSITTQYITYFCKRHARFQKPTKHMLAQCINCLFFCLVLPNPHGGTCNSDNHDTCDNASQDKRRGFYVHRARPFRRVSKLTISLYPQIGLPFCSSDWF